MSLKSILQVYCDQKGLNLPLKIPSRAPNVLTGGSPMTLWRPNDPLTALVSWQSLWVHVRRGWPSLSSGPVATRGHYGGWSSKQFPGIPVKLWILRPHPKPPKWKSLHSVTTPSPSESCISKFENHHCDLTARQSFLSCMSSLGWKFCLLYR